MKKEAESLFLFFLSCGKLQNNNSKHRKRNVDMELLYRSTRDSSVQVTASQAILKGLSADGGLFVPMEIPALNVSLDELAKMSYQETAYAVMSKFLTDFTEEELKHCIDSAYDEKFDTPEIAPLVKADGAYFLELFHRVQGYGALHPAPSDDRFRKEESGEK